MPPPVGSDSEDELLKLPLQDTFDALYMHEKHSGVCGLYCAYKHCHNQVPYGKHGDQEAMATNLCKQCFNWVTDRKQFSKFPFCAVAKVSAMVSATIAM